MEEEETLDQVKTGDEENVDVQRMLNYEASSCIFRVLTLFLTPPLSFTSNPPKTAPMVEGASKAWCAN